MKRLGIARAIASATLVVSLAGCGSGSSGDKVPSTNGLVGDPCTTADDCKPTEGARPVCMTQSKGVDTWDWIGGYCTFGCNEENPKCPTGSICSSVGYRMEGQRCLATCNSDVDCRTPHYKCSSGVCESNTKADTPPPPGPNCSETCKGCCDGNGNCLPGTGDSACGYGGETCYACEAQETCVDSFGSHYCRCRNDCENGCCDPQTGACQPGDADSACGDVGTICLVCKPDEKCDLYTSQGGGTFMFCVPK